MFKLHMTGVKWGMAVMVCAGLGGVARGEGSAATQNGAAVDLGSPKAALLSVYGALKAGDVAAAKKCMHFADGGQAENFDITMTQGWAPLAVMHAMEGRFGPDVRKLFSAASLEKTADQAIVEINRAQIAVNGETAMVSEGKAAADPSAETLITGITLKKENDQWKVVAGSFPEGAGEIPAAQLPMMRSLREKVAAACETTLAKLKKGDFKTAEEAYAAYQAAVKGGGKIENGK